MGGSPGAGSAGGGGGGVLPPPSPSPWYSNVRLIVVAEGPASGLSNTCSPGSPVLLLSTFTSPPRVASNHSLPVPDTRTSRVVLPVDGSWVSFSTWNTTPGGIRYSASLPPTWIMGVPLAII